MAGEVNALLFLVPSLILFTAGLLLAGAVWLALWLVCVLFVARYFPLVQSRPHDRPHGTQRSGR